VALECLIKPAVLVRQSPLRSLGRRYEVSGKVVTSQDEVDEIVGHLGVSNLVGGGVGGEPVKPQLEDEL
jgi:hypothetical protein